MEEVTGTPVGDVALLTGSLTISFAGPDTVDADVDFVDLPIVLP